MQPYQKANEEQIRQRDLPSNFLKKAASVGGTAAASYLGAGTISKVLPFLSKYIPEDLAIKGLNKIDPRFGKFINHAMKGGHSFDEVKDFIGEKAQSEMSKENRNIIEQESPELHEFILSHIKQGRKPLEAAALATLDTSRGPNFKQIISKLQKTHKVNWGQIVQDLYGNGEQELPEQQNNQEKQQQQQPGQGQQALMSILQKIQQARGSR